MKIFGKWLPLLNFKGSSDYWNKRYKLGGDSGLGSGGEAAAYKAGVINRFVVDYGIRTVVEFGCGDGRQLLLSAYESYLGLDISDNALDRCRELFPGDPSKRFLSMQQYAGEQADLSMSLDVLFHLVEDRIYFDYLGKLFAAGRRYVVVYSTSSDQPVQSLPHVRHRAVEQDIAMHFPTFERLSAYESSLPQPVEFSVGGSTRFLLYSRKPA